MNNETHLDLAAIVPSRDEVDSFRGQRSGKKSDGSSPSPDSGSGGSLFANVMIAVSLIVAGGAVAWAYQLQEQVDDAARVRADYEVRISELEDRLSDTDESVNQSGVATQVKIKELYSEVDKLWASAWRRNKAKIEANEKGIAANADQVKNQNTTIAEVRSASKTQGVQVQKFSSMLEPLARMLESAPAERAQLENLADRLRKLDRDFSLVQKRVGTSEEDIEAINGFRRQVWAKLADIERVLPGLGG